MDGKPLAQSNTIARYLARQHGLAGHGDWEQSLADMYADNINDLISGDFSNQRWFLTKFLIRQIILKGVRPVIFEKDPAKQKELFQKV